MSIETIKDILNRNEIKPIKEYKNIFHVSFNNIKDLASFINTMNDISNINDCSIFLNNEYINIPLDKYNVVCGSIYRVNKKYSNLFNVNIKKDDIYLIITKENISDLTDIYSFLFLDFFYYDDDINKMRLKRSYSTTLPKDFENEKNRPIASQFLADYIVCKIYKTIHCDVMQNNKEIVNRYTFYDINKTFILNSYTSYEFPIKNKSDTKRVAYIKPILIDNKDVINSVKKIFPNYDFNKILLYNYKIKDNEEEITSYFYCYFCKTNSNREEELVPLYFKTISSKTYNKDILFMPAYFEVYKVIYENFYNEEKIIDGINEVLMKLENMNDIFVNYFYEQGKKIFNNFSNTIINEIKQTECGQDIIKGYENCMKNIDYLEKIKPIVNLGGEI